MSQSQERSPGEDAYLTKHEVCVLLRFRNPRTIERWCRRGLLPHYKFKREVRFLRSEIDDFLKRKFHVPAKE